MQYSHLFPSVTTYRRGLKKTKYNFNKGNYECMREKIKSIEWDDIIKHMDVEQSWSEITRQILKAEDKFIPKKLKGRVSKNQNR